jgi:spore coat polysaccharide biosynthesis protein SpsF (cytidylyltransferase family)
MNVVSVIQARFDSARLPGKALADITGSPMLAHVVRRLQASTSLTEVMIATTDRGADAPIVEVGDELGVPVYRGATEDVLGRMLGAAASAKADVVVRVTGDCPLIDAKVVDLVVDRLLENAGADYASNVLLRTYPRGLDVEAMTMEALERADALARSPSDREHVTPAIRMAPGGVFRRVSVEDTEDNSDIRLTVDEPSDLELVRLLHQRLSPAAIRDFKRIVAFLRTHPELLDLNAHVKTWSPETASDREGHGRGR